MENKETVARKGFRIVGNTFLLAVFLTGAYFINNYFFTYPVIVSVLKGAALISVLAMAEGIVLASGGIDVSIAGTSILSSAMVFYLVETNTTGVLAAVLISFVVAGAVGLLNGVFIAKLGIQPIIVTMGTSLFVHGVAGAITNNISIFDTCPGFDVFKTTISFVPVSLITALVIMGLCYALFRFTIVGRQIFAVGGGEKSAQLSGLNVDLIKIYTYTAAGFTAGIGGLMVLADSTMSARFFSGGAEMEIIFAAILGGVSLYSGAKIFFRICVGAGVIAVINRLIYGLFVFNYMRAVIVGLLFLIVIAIKKNMFKGGKTRD
jgi:ribose/xylose/arabinose/galactoside ABC-type transport system permease subunit